MPRPLPSFPVSIIEGFHSSWALADFLLENIPSGEYPYSYSVTDRFNDSEACLKALRSFRPDHKWARNSPTELPTTIYFEHEDDYLRFLMTV